MMDQNLVDVEAVGGFVQEYERLRSDAQKLRTIPLLEERNRTGLSTSRAPA